MHASNLIFFLIRDLKFFINIFYIKFTFFFTMFLSWNFTVINRKIKDSKTDINYQLFTDNGINILVHDLFICKTYMYNEFVNSHYKTIDYNGQVQCTCLKILMLLELNNEAKTVFSSTWHVTMKKHFDLSKTEWDCAMRYLVNQLLTNSIVPPCQNSNN